MKNVDFPHLKNQKFTKKIDHFTQSIVTRVQFEFLAVILIRPILVKKKLY